jgi:hypothetical protein
VVEHAGYAVGSDQSGQEAFFFDFGVFFVGLDEGLDVGEAVGLGEAAHGEVLSVAGGRGGGVVFGNRGVDFQGFVRVVLGPEFRFHSGNGHRRGISGGAEAAKMTERNGRRHFLQFWGFGRRRGEREREREGERL